MRADITTTRTHTRTHTHTHSHSYITTSSISTVCTVGDNRPCSSGSTCTPTMACTSGIPCGGDCITTSIPPFTPSTPTVTPTTSCTTSPIPYAADNPADWLPCRPGTFLCKSPTQFYTCGQFGGSQWTYGALRYVAEGMVCQPKLVPGSAKNKRSIDGLLLGRSADSDVSSDLDSDSDLRLGETKRDPLAVILAKADKLFGKISKLLGHYEGQAPKKRAMSWWPSFGGSDPDNSADAADLLALINKLDKSTEESEMGPKLVDRVIDKKYSRGLGVTAEHGLDAENEEAHSSIGSHGSIMKRLNDLEGILDTLLKHFDSKTSGGVDEERTRSVIEKDCCYSGSRKSIRNLLRKRQAWVSSDGEDLTAKQTEKEYTSSDSSDSEPETLPEEADGVEGDEREVNWKQMLAESVRIWKLNHGHPAGRGSNSKATVDIDPSDQFYDASDRSWKRPSHPEAKGDGDTEDGVGASGLKFPHVDQLHGPIEIDSDIEGDSDDGMPIETATEPVSLEEPEKIEIDDLLVDATTTVDAADQASEISTDSSTEVPTESSPDSWFDVLFEGSVETAPSPTKTSTGLPTASFDGSSFGVLLEGPVEAPSTSTESVTSDDSPVATTSGSDFEVSGVTLDFEETASEIVLPYPSSTPANETLSSQNGTTEGNPEEDEGADHWKDGTLGNFVNDDFSSASEPTAESSTEPSTEPTIGSTNAAENILHYYMGPGPVIPPNITISWPGPYNLRGASSTITERMTSITAASSSSSAVTSTSSSASWPPALPGVVDGVWPPPLPGVDTKPGARRAVNRLEKMKTAVARQKAEKMKIAALKKRDARCPLVPPGYYRDDQYVRAS